jgi:iron complex transport system substrate-binding protein
MITRQSLVALALAGSLVVGLAACGDDDDDTGSGSAAETGESSESSESPAETTTTAAESASSGDDAAGEAVATVFDSSVPFDDKVALIEDGESHRADHDGYVAAAEAVGGITVEPTDVAPSGDSATVTYRVLFGGNEAYSDLTMDVTRVDGEWIVPTDAFCGFLASARTPCAGAPAG